MLNGWLVRLPMSVERIRWTVAYERISVGVLLLVQVVVSWVMDIGIVMI